MNNVNMNLRFPPRQNHFRGSPFLNKYLMLAVWPALFASHSRIFLQPQPTGSPDTPSGLPGMLIWGPKLKLKLDKVK